MLNLPEQRIKWSGKSNRIVCSYSLQDEPDPFTQAIIGLVVFRPDPMLGRLRELLGVGESFALETTLATRIYVPFVAESGRY